jgi:hypothetical protein
MIFLRDYRMNRLGEDQRVHFSTSQKPGIACGLANFDIPGFDIKLMNQWLFDNYGIVRHVTEHPEYTGFRVTPNVFTTLDELDRFCGAVETGIRQGIGA